MSNAVTAAVLVSAIMLTMLWGMAFALTRHAEPRVRRNVMRGAVVFSIACVLIVTAVAGLLAR